MTRRREARGRPGVLDLGIAFFSGMAAAYAIARPDLSAAWPGVAISAALVPPIATAGLSLVSGRPMVAVGAALLFLMNITAIIVGAAASLFAGGIRSQHLHGRDTPWVKRTLMAAFVVAAALATIASPEFAARVSG